MFYGYYKKYARYLGRRKCLEYYIMQRILRINSDVPWPVHISSSVAMWQNIKKADGLDTPTYLGAPPGCYIQALNGIELGRNIWIASGVKIISSNHDLCDYAQHTTTEPIRIGDNCWLGANCVILPGVELGEHTVVAAGAVVTKSFPEGNCVIAGVPAQKVKDIGPYVGEPDGTELKLKPLLTRIKEKAIQRFLKKKTSV